MKSSDLGIEFKQITHECIVPTLKHDERSGVSEGILQGIALELVIGE